MCWVSYGREEKVHGVCEIPNLQKAYIAAFDRMIEERKRRGMVKCFTRMGDTGVDVFHWWMEDGILPGQTVLPGFEEDA